MGQGTETCTDRPTEVSVIRFVSRNRTIEEIAPKKEVYTCKQRGCGKIFTNQDEYKTHEALEALKIRFICREPGCGEELSDPGSMWRHYQEWHNNETNVYICPYTNCGSLHPTSGNLEEHIESCHRQPPTLPTEPEIICFEGPENTIEEDPLRTSDEPYDQAKSTLDTYDSSEKSGTRNENKIQQSKESSHEQNKLIEASSVEEYTGGSESLKESLIVTTEELLSKYGVSTANCTEVQGENVQDEHKFITQDKKKVVHVNGEVTITKNTKFSIPNNNTNGRNQERHGDFSIEIDHDENSKGGEDDSRMETNSNCSEDEEYTPKKQRVSRYKQEIYKCAVNGCGKKYKYISHYRHHQDSHKLVAGTISSNSSKAVAKLKQGKASTVSFFLCKIPGCGVQANNVTGLWKHYQDNHANSKLPTAQSAKSNEVFRCKIPGCEVEFDTTGMLYKHFSEVHGNNASTNAKTGNGSSFHYTEVFKDDTTSQQGNFKTDFKAKHNVSEYTKVNDEQRLTSVVKKETRD